MIGKNDEVKFARERRLIKKVMDNLCRLQDPMKIFSQHDRYHRGWIRPSDFRSSLTELGVNLSNAEYFNLINCLPGRNQYVYKRLSILSY